MWVYVLVWPDYRREDVPTLVAFDCVGKLNEGGYMAYGKGNDGYIFMVWVDGSPGRTMLKGGYVD